MGCDYYTWIETVVEYTDGEGKAKTYVEKPDFDHYERHYEGYSRSYDPDFEDPPESGLEIRKREYGEKILYNGARWLCNQSGIDRVKEILASKNIAITSVACAFKRMNGYWR